MLLLNLSSTDPHFNLAVDEYLLKSSKSDFLVLGINEKSVIIGKHQVAHREADTRFVTEFKIPVIRRISGGGSVFHDPGNLNFSFILNSTSGKQVDFRKYTLPVIEFLASQGINAIFEGRNDLKVGGLKISGNAEHVFRNRVLHHGTLLFESDLEFLKGSLRKETGNYKTNGVVSNPSSVTNLNHLLKGVENISEFRSLIVYWFLKKYNGSQIYSLTPEAVQKISSLAEGKYRTWEWNYGYGPEYQFTNSFVFENKECFCRLNVRDGIINESEIRGHRFLESVGKKMIGCRHMTTDIKKLISQLRNLLSSGFDIYNFF